MILAAISLAYAVCAAEGVRIICVHDGDSFIVDRERIRIADIDTPELDGQGRYESELAVRARYRLTQLLNAETFEIRRQGEDRYGRKRAFVANSQGSIGDQLVREGLARTRTKRREPLC
ncbi:thermonuclease family protein [Aurantiacibacter rhizosphaerae]|uniref:Thermonuclease family protein n=1 Tax=Aurantiacibacter rhizosphaerae TaxID=2691582 RepID=A0A844XB58_9SPHN|nr:thermonuclease family protein [Aurantiacibacter rhizosphaerae]MWV26952.1 thermonuclease family protein [Aurantiacibacter rhizosphaerae]